MKGGRRSTVIPSYICPINTVTPVKNPPEKPKNCRRSSRLASITKVTSNPQSRSLPRRKRRRIQTLPGIPNMPGIDDPEGRRRALMRWIASTQPKWSPCPPTASESFLHELPADYKIPVDNKVPAADYKIPVDNKVPAADDLAVSRRNILLQTFNSAIMRARNNSTEIPVCDKVAVDDPVIDNDVFDRDGRRYEAEKFRKSYTYGCNDSMEQKTCIWSSGTCTWMEKSSGIMWVAVHGMNSICLVTRYEALDLTRLGSYLKARKQHVCKLFRETLISEMEDLADLSSEARQNIHQSFDKPFAVVSLIPAGTNKANEESGTEASGAVYDEKRAINFLLEKMKSVSTFTYGYSETLQTAISAFLLLFDKELKAKDIKVCVWAKDHGARDLWIRDAGENLVVMYHEGIETLVERLPK